MIYSFILFRLSQLYVKTCVVTSLTKLVLMWMTHLSSATNLIQLFFGKPTRLLLLSFSNFSVVCFFLSK